jgi:hypothetical protein
LTQKGQKSFVECKGISQLYCELGSDRCETGWFLSFRSVAYLQVNCHQYERNVRMGPLVDGLSDKALPSSYALPDKS